MIDVARFTVIITVYGGVPMSMPTVHVTIVQHKCSRQVTVFTRSGEELLELPHGILVRLRVGHVEHLTGWVGLRHSSEHQLISIP